MGNCRVQVVERRLVQRLTLSMLAICLTMTLQVGHWHWCGVTCSCGAWITPAFQIPHSRVDRLLSRGASVLKDVKMPLFGTPTSVVHGSSST